MMRDMLTAETLTAAKGLRWAAEELLESPSGTINPGQRDAILALSRHTEAMVGQLVDYADELEARVERGKTAA